MFVHYSDLVYCEIFIDSKCEVNNEIRYCATDFFRKVGSKNSLSHSSIVNQITKLSLFKDTSHVPSGLTRKSSGLTRKCKVD